MRHKVKQKRFQVWLDQTELDFIYKYAEKNHLTGSELFRGWLHEVMKREGHEIKEPSLPESKTKNKGVK